MNPPSSSTSNSEGCNQPADSYRRPFLKLLAWVLTWLVALDIAAATLFAYPRDPRNLDPNPLALYFDYGRSMEGRLRRATRSTPEATAPITLAGWYDPLIAIERHAEPGAPKVTIYGMSHAVRLADALDEVAPQYRVRSIGAPGAGTNWAYGAFLRDEHDRIGDVAVLAIMSSTLPMILSPTPMDWNTSFAMPYTADRFIDTGDGLKRIRPPYESFPDYVRALNEKGAWEAALGQFARTDPFFDRFLVEATPLDKSTIVRLARRGWSQRRDRQWRETVLTADGYDAESEPVRVANAIISSFARQAREAGVVPVIYIVDSFGYGDQLSQALSETLRREAIPYLASSRYLDPMVPTNYLPDSHFTDSNDRELAAVLARIIDRELSLKQLNGGDLSKNGARP